MFNPFNAFQSFGQAASDAAKTADNAGTTSPGMNAGMTSGPFGPAFGAAKEKIEAGMQDWQSQMQSFFNPQKMFDMNAVKNMFPKELTQAWSAFAPATTGGSSNPLQQMQEMGQQLASQAQQTMQAMQGAVSQVAQQGSQPTGAVSSALGSVDLSALIKAQQKNMDVLSQAHSATVSGWQQVMKRQAEIFHDTMQTAANAMHELMATGAPEDKLARQADLAKQAFETAGKNIEELAKLVTEGNQEAMRVVGARVQESLDEIKAAAQKNPMTRAAADVTAQATQAANSFTNAASDTFRAAKDAAIGDVGQ